MKAHDRRAAFALAAGAVGGLMIACGVGWLVLRPGDGGGNGPRTGGAPRLLGDFAEEEKAVHDYFRSQPRGEGDEFLRWGPHLRLTEGHVLRMGNPDLVRPGDVIVRVVGRSPDPGGVMRQHDLLVFVRDGLVVMRPLLGDFGGPQLPLSIVNQWGDDWPNHIEAAVRRLLDRD